MKLWIAVTVALVAVLAPAHAKTCGPEFGTGLISRAEAVDGSMKRCLPVAKKFDRKKASAQDFCGACGPAAWNMVKLERYANDYASCFRASASGRKLLRDLRRSRNLFKELKTVCGY